MKANKDGNRTLWATCTTVCTCLREKHISITSISIWSSTSSIELHYLSDRKTNPSLPSVTILQDHCWRYCCDILLLCESLIPYLFPKAAKLANYAKYQRLCDGLFVVFSISFFITRLVIYPFWWVKWELIYKPNDIPFPPWHIFRNWRVLLN